MAKSKREDDSDRRLITAALRDHSRAITDDDIVVDMTRLAADLDSIADQLADGVAWECHIQTPFAEIYAVGAKSGGALEYRCRHDPYHTFTG